MTDTENDGAEKLGLDFPDETDYLNSISGVHESILAAKKEPLSEASKEAGW